MSFLVLAIMAVIAIRHWLIPAFKRDDERYRAIMKEFDNE